MAEYCTASDLYTYGLPRGALPNPGRLASSASASTNAISLDVHGFDMGDEITLRAEAGGSLPSPLVAATTYYARPVNDNSFQLSAVPGGSAIDLTTAGARFLIITPLPIQGTICWASRIIDDMLPAHVVPLVFPYHELIVATTAELAIGKLLGRAGSASKSLAEMVDAANARLAKWARGIPLRGDNTPQAANLSVSASIPYSDARGWARYGGL